MSELKLYMQSELMSIYISVSRADVSIAARAGRNL